MGAQPHCEGETMNINPTWGYWDQLFPTIWSSDLQIDNPSFQMIKMYEKQDMSVCNSKHENKAKQQTAKFLDAFNRRRTMLLEAVE